MNALPPSEPADGGLLTVQMETANHVAVVHCLARAIAREDDLDLAIDSSSWKHPAVASLYNELMACEFHHSGKCPVEFHSWMDKLSNGSPIFGDDFRTSWEYYTCFTNEEEEAVGLASRATWLLETDIKEKVGVNFSRREIWKPYMVEDRNLVTGQNPQSAAALAKRLLEVLEERIPPRPLAPTEVHARH